MTDLIKIALIGGGALIGYNYLQKRKKNQLATNSILDTKETNIVAAAMEEEGEEGMAVATGNDAKLAKLASSLPTYRQYDGWDSDTLV